MSEQHYDKKKTKMKNRPYDEIDLLDINFYI